MSYSSCDLLVKCLPYSFCQEQYWSKADDELVARVKGARELILIHDNLLSVFSSEDLSVMLKGFNCWYSRMSVVWPAVWLNLYLLCVFILHCMSVSFYFYFICAHCTIS